MSLPFDIVEHIFSFLKSHPKALFACSKAHPLLSRIIERYRFHHIIIQTEAAALTHNFSPSDLLRHLTETPRIVKYVAVLQIEYIYERSRGSAQMTPYLEEIAPLLPMFPVLQCIMLPTLGHPNIRIFAELQDLPLSFKTAVENCLRLPSLQEIHVGDVSFPLSLLDNHANINYLSLSGPPKFEPEYLEATSPQIISLAFEGFEHRRSEVFLTWAKRHIVGLQSLKYDLSCHRIILEVFKICSDTLENLYLCLHRQGTPPEVDSLELSSLPHLRHITIHTEMFFDHGLVDFVRHSYFSVAADILKSASPLQQLTIEIYVAPSSLHFEEINFSRLSFLAESSVSFHHIDLYMYTGSPQLPITYTQMGLWLSKYKGLMKLVEEGVLVIHPEETAPTLSRFYIAREDNDQIS